MYSDSLYSLKHTFNKQFISHSILLFKVMAEKEKFSKELEKNIKILLPNGHVSFLSKVFKLAYETPYLSKVDYGSVELVILFAYFFHHFCSSQSCRNNTRKGVGGTNQFTALEIRFLFQILNQIKTQSLSCKSLNSRSIKEKGNSNLICKKLNSIKTLPSTSCNHDGDADDSGILKIEQAIVLLRILEHVLFKIISQAACCWFIYKFRSLILCMDLHERYHKKITSQKSWAFFLVYLSVFFLSSHCFLFLFKIFLKYLTLATQKRIILQ